MGFVSSDLIGSGNTLFPDSLFPVMGKPLYIQCITTRAATLPLPFPFPQKLIRLMREKIRKIKTIKKIKKKPKTVEQAK